MYPEESRVYEIRLRCRRGAIRSVGYGLGRAGWVTVPLLRTTPPLGVLKDWVEESYRRVAPKRLVTELDEVRR